MWRPYVCSKPDRYGRLFAPAESIFPREVLVELGRSTAGDISSVSLPLRRTPPPAAYTYFGQFIDHNLSLDRTPLAEAGREPGETVNEAGGRLDLGHLYGDGPGSPAHAHLYADDGASFRLGESILENGEPFDLPPRGPDQADAHPHNRENIILRQLHAMFLKLHNCAVAELAEVEAPGMRFARERVTWQYQWLVRHDFLPRITETKVYRAVTGSKEGWEIDWESEGFSVPVEFTHAVFRFGHSMVRPEYRLSLEEPPVSLREIFSRSAMRQPLERAQAVDWEMFTVGRRNGVTENAMVIDTRVATPLHSLPARPVMEGVPPLPAELPVRTLLRGAASRLPSGETVAAAFQREPLVSQNYRPGQVNPWEKLEELGLRGRTPLWFWILLEAETESGGACLGTVGSRIVAEVIEDSLWAEGGSYLRRWGRAWRPPAWKLGAGGEQPIRTLADLARVTGLLRPRD